MIFLLLVLALQEPRPREDRIEYTAPSRPLTLSEDQRRAVDAVGQLGALASYCRAFMPEEDVRHIDQAERPGPHPSLLDNMFFSGVAYARARPDDRPYSAETCWGLLADGRLLVEAYAPELAQLEARFPPAATRPWTVIADNAVATDIGDAARRRREDAPLVPPAEQVRPGAIRTPPQWAEAPRLSFPAQARGHVTQAAVQIQCIITVDGRARACRVLSESVEGYGFAEAALAAQDMYRFTPSTLDGQPVESRGVFRVLFRQ